MKKIADRLVVVATFQEPTQAHVARSLLESAGIRAALDGEYHIAMDWFVSNAMGGVKLIVHERDFETATWLLHEVRLDKSAPEITDETDDDASLEKCPFCGSIEIYPERLHRKLVFLSLMVLGIPLPFLSGKTVCETCGNRWDSSNAGKQPSIDGSASTSWIYKSFFDQPMTTTQNVSFVGKCPPVDGIDHPPGEGIARLLERSLRDQGFNLELVDNWRDCGWLIWFAIENSKFEIALASMAEANVWMLQIACASDPGVIARLFGKRAVDHCDEVHKIACAVHDILQANGYTELRWRLNGFPDKEQSTPTPLHPQEKPPPLD